MGGARLELRDAIFTLTPDGAGGQRLSAIKLGDHPELCALEKAGRVPRSATLLTIAPFGFQGGHRTQADPGEYTTFALDGGSAAGAPAGPGRYAVATFVKLDESCVDTLGATRSGARSGLTTLERVEPQDDGTVTGRFDLSFGESLDRVTGTFEARACVVPGVTSAPTCE